MPGIDGAQRLDASLCTHLSQLSVLNYCAVAAEILLESLQDLLVVNAFFQTLQSQIWNETVSKNNLRSDKKGANEISTNHNKHQVGTKNRSPAPLSSSFFRCAAGCGYAHNLYCCCRLSQRLQKHLQNHRVHKRRVTSRKTSSLTHHKIRAQH